VTTAASLREHIAGLLAAGPDRSNRSVARELGCSKGTVAKWRARLTAGTASHEGRDAPPPTGIQADQTASAPVSGDRWECAACWHRQLQPAQERCEQCGAGQNAAAIFACRAST
jgi:hypothetical protein